MCVFLATILADWIEGAKFALIRQMPSKLPCHTCECPLEEFHLYESGCAASLRFLVFHFPFVLFFFFFFRGGMNISSFVQQGPRSGTSSSTHRRKKLRGNHAHELMNVKPCLLCTWRTVCGLFPTLMFTPDRGLIASIAWILDYLNGSSSFCLQKSTSAMTQVREQQKHQTTPINFQIS